MEDIKKQLIEFINSGLDVDNIVAVAERINALETIRHFVDRENNDTADLIEMECVCAERYFDIGGTVNRQIAFDKIGHADTLLKYASEDIPIQILGRLKALKSR